MNIHVLKSESDALADWAVDLNQLQLDAFLGRYLGVQLHQFSSATLAMPIVALNFVTWLEGNPHHLVPLLTAIVKDYGQHASATTLTAMLHRLGHVQVVAAQNLQPWGAALVRGVPMVNRTQLRRALQQMVGAGWREVMLISGPERTGRSHSFHLIEHVARSTRTITAHKIDLLESPVEHRSIENVLKSLLQRLQLPLGDIPSTAGATVETIAARFSDAFWQRLTAKPPAATAWLVFDSVDRPVLPEVRLFVCQVAQLCLEGQLPNCKVFLLGADRTFGIQDQYQRLDLENLTLFLPNEIQDAAASLNALGARPLGAVDLQTRVAEMQTMLSTVGPREVCEAISSKLVQLRDEVQA